MNGAGAYKMETGGKMEIARVMFEVPPQDRGGQEWQGRGLPRACHGGRGAPRSPQRWSDTTAAVSVHAEPCTMSGVCPFPKPDRPGHDAT